jgi:hypothetical protein
MHNLNSLPNAALMGRHVFKEFDVGLSALQMSQAINSISPKVLCVASAAILLVMGAGDAGAREISRPRQSAHSYYLWSGVASNLRDDNRYEARYRDIGHFHLGEGPSGAVVAQSGYGPGLMDAPPGQPGNMSAPMGISPPQPGYGPGSMDAPPGQPGYMPGPIDFPAQQPGYGSGSMDAPSGQPGYMPAPTDFPSQQPGSMSAPTGLPRTTPAYGTDTTGAPPVQTGPNLPSTAIPPARPEIGPGTTGSFGARNESEPTVLRATNTARMRAESLNGGLRVYRSSSCMYQQSGGECLIKNDSDGYLFRFLGGEPGWQQLGKPPTLETEILIARDGKTVSRLLYNGPPRSVSTHDSLQGAPQPATIKP